MSRKAATLVATLLLGFQGLLGGQALQERLSARVDEAAAAGFSGAVLVAGPTGILLQRGVGLADRERGVPIDDRTIFSIGSVTKQFTRAAIALLAERGRLSLDAPITRFFDNVPADKAGITVQHLLDMRAGMAEYLDRDGEQGDFTPLTREQALARMWETPLAFPPGSDRAYSNAGYTMLALIIERVSGKTYEEFVRSELLAPAGLTRTGFYGDRSAWAPHEVAVGYGGRRVGERNSPWYWSAPQWALIGSGGMASSPAELYRWITALRAGRVLSVDGLRTLYGGSVPTGPAPTDRPAVMYAGVNDFGFQTGVIELYDGAGVIIVSGNSDSRPFPFAEDLASILVGRPIAVAPRRQVETQGGPGTAVAQPGNNRWGLPDSPRGWRVAQILDMISAGTPAAVDSFIAEALDPEFRDGSPMAQHRAILGDLQRELRDPEITDLTVVNGRVTLRVRSSASGAERSITLSLANDQHQRIAMMAIGEP